uniref:Transmembrane epididymal protein 1 n=1 Tax=Oryctolagus cuniculus TaxID=9986 RepID=G1U1V1_RABIT
MTQRPPRASHPGAWPWSPQRGCHRVCVCVCVVCRRQRRGYAGGSLQDSASTCFYGQPRWVLLCQHLPCWSRHTRRSHGHLPRTPDACNVLPLVLTLLFSAGVSGPAAETEGVNRLVIIDWKDPQRSFLFKDAWHHITMYGFFVFSGVVDIMSQWRRERQWVKLERAAEALAFYVLALLMANHLENKSTLEIRVHVLFMVPVLLVALVLSIEVWVPEQPQLWVLKTWMGLVLSSWLLQLSVLLYMPPSGQPWRADNPTDIAFLGIFFCWHLALGIAILATTYGLCSLWHHRFSSWTEATGAGYKLCPTDSRGEELEKLKAEAVLQDGGI